jgi:hypothetical protein
LAVSTCLAADTSNGNGNGKLNMAPFKIIYLGAGHVNFGHPAGLVPWNHSIRLQKFPSLE